MKTLKYVLPFAVLSIAVQAQEVQVPQGAFALVNAQPIDNGLLQANVDANVARGLTDTQQLRARIKNELISQEILVQESKNLKLDQSPQAQAALHQLRQNFLIGLLRENFNRNNPVSEEQIKAEYDKFVQSMKGEKEYKLSLISVPTKERAEKIIAQLNQSKDAGLFSKIASAESTDESKKQGGSLNWLVSGQILPAVSNVVANLSKGKVSSVPIQTDAGWNIVRVDNVRPYTPPSLKELEPQLRQAIAQRAWVAYIQELQKKAKIVAQ